MSPIDYFATNIVPKMYRGKGALHPCETGVLTSQVSCVREFDVNIYFVRKGEMLIAIDAGYKNYDGFVRACRKANVDPALVRAVFLTHVDPDHAGGLDVNCANVFPRAQVYLGRIEENYLTNTYHRKKIGPFAIKNSVSIAAGYHLLEDGEMVNVGGIGVQAFLVPGHTLGHLAYLIDGDLLFTGDAIALNQQGGWCFFDTFNYDSALNKRSLAQLRKRLDINSIRYVFTAHNGFTDQAATAFAHIDTMPNLNKRGFVFDETAPYDCFAPVEAEVA